MTKPPISDAARIFGERVRARRQELGLSQEQIAEGSQMHWSYFGQVERGRRNLTLHSMLRLAAVLGVDAGELVRGLPVPAKPDRD
ncbi:MULTISPECIES: helix-turn-helix domain-containing protein [Streptomyces]|uniref:helix-turn-helix domain-containing protein n=1 Tax=Streptomyces TaxID=1883 RepID=UPI0036DBDFC0